MPSWTSASPSLSTTATWPRTSGTSGARAGAIAEAWQKEPPRIAIAPDPAKGAPVVDGETFRLGATVTVPASADPDARLRDVYVFVNDEKAFFKVAPEGSVDARLDFSTELKLACFV